MQTLSLKRLSSLFIPGSNKNIVLSFKWKICPFFVFLSLPQSLFLSLSFSLFLYLALSFPHSFSCTRYQEFMVQLILLDSKPNDCNLC